MPRVIVVYVFMLSFSIMIALIPSFLIIIVIMQSINLLYVIAECCYSDFQTAEF